MKKMRRFWVFACFLMVAMVGMKGQQYTIMNQEIYNQQLFNPAAMGIDGLHDIHLRNQLRRMNFGDLSYSQLLAYSSVPFNSKRTMAWGVFLKNDLEFTERRLDVMANFSIHVLNDSVKRLSFGGGVGLINLSSRLDEVPVYDPNDPLRFDFASYALPNVSLGMDFRLRKKSFEFYLGGTANQLPGQFSSPTAAGLTMIPHVLGRMTFMYKTADGSFNVGPLFLYKTIIPQTYDDGREVTSLGKGSLDCNLKFAFPQRNLWFGAGYRVNNTALNAALGINLFNVEDSIRIKKLDLSANFELPLGDAKAFGSNFELGLRFVFGKKQLKAKDKTIYIEIPKWTGALWKNTSNLNYYLDEKWYLGISENEIASMSTLDTEFRQMVTAKSFVSDESVILTFEYEERNLQYDLYQQDGARKLAEIIMNNVIPECLHPAKRDSQPIADSLQSVWYVSLSSKFAFDSVSAQTETPVIFGGDWDLSVVQEPYLNDGSEIVTYIEQGDNVTNLELAILKLISLKKAFQNKPELRDKIEKLIISSDNPGQDVPLVTKITVGFRKYER